MRRTISCLNRGYIAFFALVALCITIRPRSLTANDGISYFGVFRTTLAPYAVAFLTAAWQFVRASRGVLESSTQAWLRNPLRICAVCMVGLLLTPHDIPPWSHAHIVFGTVLFALQFVIGWILTSSRSDLLTLAYALVMTVAGLVSFEAVIHAHGWMIQGQIVFQASFWGLLAHRLGQEQPEVVEAELPAH